MEMFCANLHHEDDKPTEIIFSASSLIDARNKLAEQYPNSNIISIEQLLSS